MMVGDAEHSPASQLGISVDEPDQRAAGFCESYLSGVNAIGKKKKKNKNRRRFSDEQITSLETVFESETKLEPRKKLQVARELGLQPRQVAIWFQNKRARWKSKQLERDYSILRSNYHNLASQFEALNKEKQALVMQLQKLNDLMEQSRKESQCRSKEIVGNNNVDRGSDNGGENSRSEFDIRTGLSVNGIEYGVGMLSDDDSSNIKAEFLGLVDESDPLNFVEPADSTSLTSPENWGNLDADLLDQPTSYSQWWDFWS